MNTNKNTIEILIKQNAVIFVDEEYMIFDEFKCQIEEGLVVNYNGSDCCIVNEYRNKEEKMPSFKLESLLLPDNTTMISLKGVPVSSSEILSDLKLADKDDMLADIKYLPVAIDTIKNKFKIGLLKGTKLQNKETYEKYYIEDDSKAILC
jgi:hypothetical protein